MIFATGGQLPHAARRVFKGAMISRITTCLRYAFIWSCAILAIGVAVLFVRSFWRCDEAGYYSYKPAPPSEGRDCRNLIGSWRGGIFWLNTETDITHIVSNTVSWYAGEPTEILLDSSPAPRLTLAALGTTRQQGIQLVPQWRNGGFDLKSDSGQQAQYPGIRVRLVMPWQWRYRYLVVPHPVPFLLLAWAPVLCLRHRWIRYRWRKQGLCINCGYDIRASGAVCSECGHSLLRTASASKRVGKPRFGHCATIIAAGLLVAGAALLSHYRNSPADPCEPVVRLNPATVLREGQLSRRVEFEVAPGVSMQFALIPSGRFVMGSPPSEIGRHEDEGQHEVIIDKPFYLGITEVTQEQFQAVTGMNPSMFAKGARYPVESVAWQEATEFCRHASEQSGRKLRLPTEAEWEYACRAGTTTPFHTGSKLTRDMAAYHVAIVYPSYRRGDPRPFTLPVGSFRPNAWGLYDMHGSVYEWCSAPYGDHPVRDRQETGARLRGILRGGSASDGPESCRAAWRYHRPGGSPLQAGFRVCLDF